MKKFLSIVLVLGLMLGMAMPALAGEAPKAETGRTITVEGRAAVKVKPDVAYVSVGVRTQSTEAKEAQAQNTKIMNDVIEAVRALGIEDKDIRTSDYYMYPEYDYNAGQKITGYSVSNNVNVTVRNIELASMVIDAAVEEGANTTGSVSFNVSEPSTHYQQALREAMADAQAKAEAIAGALGQSVGLPLSVVEKNDNYYSSLMSGNAAASAEYGAGDSSTPIQSGELEITATLQVTYAYTSGEWAAFDPEP